MTDASLGHHQKSHQRYDFDDQSTSHAISHMTKHHNVTRKAKKSINLLSPYSNKNRNQPFKINGHYQQLSLLMSLKLHFWNMLLVIILPFVKVLAVEFGGCVISFIILPAISSHLLIIQIVHGFSKLLIKKKQQFER